MISSPTRSAATSKTLCDAAMTDQLIDALAYIIIAFVGVMLVWAIVGMVGDLVDLMWRRKIDDLKKENAELKKQLEEKEKEK